MPPCGSSCEKNDYVHVTHNGIKYNMIVFRRGPWAPPVHYSMHFLIPNYNGSKYEAFVADVASRPGQCFQIGKCFCNVSWVVLVTTDLTLMLKI